MGLSGNDQGQHEKEQRIKMPALNHKTGNSLPSLSAVFRLDNVQCSIFNVQVSTEQAIVFY